MFQHSSWPSHPHAWNILPGSHNANSPSVAMIPSFPADPQIHHFTCSVRSSRVWICIHCCCRHACHSRKQISLPSSPNTIQADKEIIRARRRQHHLMRVKRNRADRARARLSAQRSKRFECRERGAVGVEDADFVAGCSTVNQSNQVSNFSYSGRRMEGQGYWGRVGGRRRTQQQQAHVHARSYSSPCPSSCAQYVYSLLVSRPNV